MSNIPTPGQLYRHFKGNLYRIVTLAKDSETGENMVVYQALYGSFACYVKPLALFMDKMEHVEYPDAGQGYRFGQDPLDMRMQSGSAGRAEDKAVCVRCDENSELQADPALLRFLDADTLEEKLQILKSLEHSITDRLIDDFAAALDLVIPDGSLTNRYTQLLSSVRTMQRFENSRFR